MPEKSTRTRVRTSSRRSGGPVAAAASQIVGQGLARLGCQKSNGSFCRSGETVCWAWGPGLGALWKVSSCSFLVGVAGYCRVLQGCCGSPHASSTLSCCTCNWSSWKTTPGPCVVHCSSCVQCFPRHLNHLNVSPTPAYHVALKAQHPTSSSRSYKVEVYEYVVGATMQASPVSCGRLRVLYS
jgi:hypothetical protein